MFIGHFALAFAAKRVAPRASLGATFVAVQTADLLWPVFLLLGWERVAITPNTDPFLNLTFTSYPWSHSLLMLVIWGVVLGAIGYVATRDKLTAVVLGLLVVSHWVLDVVVHVPDIPLAPGVETRLGLGLWRNPSATLAVEGLMFIAGVVIYARTTTARDRVGTWGLWSLVALLGVIYASSIVSPPPPSVSALATTALVGWPLMLWPWWVDRNRGIRSGTGFLFAFGVARRI